MVYPNRWHTFIIISFFGIKRFKYYIEQQKISCRKFVYKSKSYPGDAITSAPSVTHKVIMCNEHLCNIFFNIYTYSIYEHTYT